MFKRPKSKHPLDDVIEDAISQLKGFTADEDMYTKQINNIDQLIKLKQLEKPERLSKDVLVTAASSVLGIIIIVSYEHAHVMTSKALNFVQKTS